MAILGRQVSAGGTASLLLTLVDLDSTAPPVADAAPVITIIDPRGIPVIANGISTPLGGGLYVYNYATQATQVKGTYLALYDYTVLGSLFREDFKFEVI